MDKGNLSYIDGLPGINVPGDAGIKGNNGAKTFVYSYDSSSSIFAPYNTFDIWDEANRLPNNPELRNISNNLNDTEPAVDDYVIYTTNGTTILYLISNVINLDTLKDLDKMKELYKGIYSEKFIENIYYFYKSKISSGALGKMRNCCICKTICKYNMESESVSPENISVTISTEPLNLKTWYGNVYNNKPVHGFEQVNIISFIINIGSNVKLDKTCIVAEFVKDNYTDISGIVPSLWSTNNSSNNTDFIYGHKGSYSYSLNYDNEDLGNFSMILKDWTENGSRSFVKRNTGLIKEKLDEYTIKIYVYSSNNKSYIKNFIGSISVPGI